MVDDTEPEATRRHVHGVAGATALAGLAGCIGGGSGGTATPTEEAMTEPTTVDGTGGTETTDGAIATTFRSTTDTSTPPSRTSSG